MTLFEVAPQDLPAYHALLAHVNRTLDTVPGSMIHDWQFDTHVLGHDVYKCVVCGCSCEVSELRSIEEMEQDDTCPGVGTEDD